MPQANKIGLYSQTGEVSYEDVQKVARALDFQLKTAVCPGHGLVPWCCDSYAALGDVPDDTIQLVVLTNADTAGALGYHDVAPDGRAYGKVFSDDTLKHGGTVLKGDNSVSVTVGHEGCEIVGDVKCNKWVVCSDGTMEALELCDRVESQGVDQTSAEAIAAGAHEATMSNFLLPAGFDPNAEPGSKRDFLGSTTRDAEILPGGYRIYLRPGKEQQEFAKHLDGLSRQLKLSVRDLHNQILAGSVDGSLHFRYPNGVHVVHFPASGIFVEFGSAYPEHKKAAKLSVASSRLRRRVA